MRYIKKYVYKNLIPHHPNSSRRVRRTSLWLLPRLEAHGVLVCGCYSNFMRNNIIHGDSLEVLKTFDTESIDLLCTDPPYGYSFMGKSWDKTLPDIGIFKEAFRVLKPGAFAFVMSAPRSDVCARMMILLEDAGFNIGFTPIYWTYASGFPKAMNIGKMVDKRAGAVRTTGPIDPSRAGRLVNQKGDYKTETGWSAGSRKVTIDPPATEAAKALDGSSGGVPAQARSRSSHRGYEASL